MGRKGVSVLGRDEPTARCCSCIIRRSRTDRDAGSIWFWPAIRTAGKSGFRFVGALLVPKGVGAYDHGYYETPGGPLYVNAGIGTYRIPFRWNCRPEITVVTI